MAVHNSVQTRSQRMHLHTTGILDMLEEKTGRYIEHHRGLYVMKESDGSNVFVIEDGERAHIHPTESQVNDLVTAGHLLKEGDRYHLQ